jgi:hypothetical protein
MHRIMKTGLAVMAAAITGLVSGCQFGALSQTQTYSDRYAVTLQREHPDILQAVADVGKEMGFMPSINKIAGNVTLMKSPGSGSYLFGVIRTAHLTVTATERGTKLDIIASVGGNLGSGGEKDTVQLVEDFKGKLFARVGER